MTCATIVYDEFAFLKFNAITYKSALFAFSKASENAKKQGNPYGMVITTTPNSLDNPSGAFCYEMVENAAKWNLNCFDFNEEQLTQFVNDNSTNDFIFVQYSYKELGRDEAWVEKQRRLCQNDEWTIKREIFLVWPNSMEGALFREEQLDKVLHFVKKPVCTILVKNGRFPISFYETPDFNLNYILSCDVSGGLSNDNSVITIIHPEDFRVVGDFKNAKIDTDTFRQLIEELMTFYLKNALLVIEKTGIGSPVIDTLMKNPNIEPRMYREKKERQAEKVQRDGFIVRKKTDTVVYGVDTTKQTREQMMDILMDIVENEYDKLISENIYKDLVTLERKKNGKIEHAVGKHDDCIMSYLIFRWAVYYGKCFKDRFGISPIPSRANVRTVSSMGDIKRIEDIISKANSQVLGQESLATNPMYSALLDQTIKMEEENPNSEVNQLNRFIKLFDM